LFISIYYTLVISALICVLDGKKGGHTATPHPAKKGGKTPSSEAKAKTPNNEAKTPMSGGLSCKSCSKYDFIKTLSFVLLNWIVTDFL